MSLTSDLGGLAPTIALVAAVGVLAAVLWFAWRKPTWLFLVALACLAIRPQLLWGGPSVGYEWGLHQTLIVFALAMNALHYGIRRTVNWPILALMATFCLSLALGDPHPKLTLPFMLQSLAVLALPFVFTQVVLEPGSRRMYALTIGLSPLLSVAIGGALQLAGLHSLFDYEEWNRVYRLQGATGNPVPLAILAFAGFAAMLHELTRHNRPYAAYLAALDLAITILTGTRMAVIASATLLLGYALVSSDFRKRWRQHRIKTVFSIFVAGVVLASYLPSLYDRMFVDQGGTAELSGRDRIWRIYFDEFSASPVFGRGIGVGFVAAADLVPWPRKTPHNEYLHLLVSGGVVGLLLMFTAIAAWCRRLLRVVSANDRELVVALLPALMVFAITEDVLVFSTSLALYAYVALPLTRPGNFLRSQRSDDDIFRAGGVRPCKPARLALLTQETGTITSRRDT